MRVRSFIWRSIGKGSMIICVSLCHRWMRFYGSKITSLHQSAQPTTHTLESWMNSAEKIEKKLPSNSWELSDPLHQGSLDVFDWGTWWDREHSRHHIDKAQRMRIIYNWCPFRSQSSCQSCWWCRITTRKAQWCHLGTIFHVRRTLYHPPISTIFTI